MKTRTQSKIALLLAMLMIFASLTLVSCAEPTPTELLWEEAIHQSDAEVGEGEKTFTLTVTAGEKSVTLTVHTDEKTLADALVALELVEGEDSQFGLYVKKVNGILADYDVDSYYWNLLVDGEPSPVGASGVDVTDGARYEFRREK